MRSRINRWFFLFLSLSSLPSIASLQVTSVTPSTGPTIGGLAVTINGNGFCGGTVCTPASTPQVFFHGQFAADVELISDTTIRVLVPPGLGSSIVLVNSPSFGAAALEHAFTYVTSSASDYERILVPVIGLGPGAYNTLWLSELYVHNSGVISSFVSYPSAHPCALCPPPPPPAGIGSLLLRPNETSTFNVFLERTTSPMTPGVVLYVSPKPARDSVSFELLLRNDAFRRDKWGIEIPVVREDRFRVGTTELMNIPLDPRYRVMLRVYDVDNVQDGADTSVIVRRYVRHNDSERLVDEQTLDLREIAGGGEFVAFPGYGSLSGITADLASTVDTLRVEVQPVTPGLRYWAFASVTNNETQDVTVISPH